MKAVILAAGRGTRLGAGHPKGLIEIGGRTLIERSLAALERIGLAPPTLVVGHGKERYLALGDRARYIVNDRFETTSTLQSLVLAHEALRSDLVVLESDLLYERRALDAVIAAPNPNTLLLGGISQAGDEVWVHAPGGRMSLLSKDRAELPEEPTGEYVGIATFSKALLDDLSAYLKEHPQASYDGDGLMALRDRHDIGTVLVPDLVWGEIDYEAQLVRCREVVLPRLLALGE
ncbi:MAG: NTP transferase domain-containing protein [Mesorhizobium sp.]